MSRPFPECPVYVPVNCTDYRNPRICALVRADQRCLHRPGRRQERISIGLGKSRPAHHPEVLRNKETPRTKGNSHFYAHYDRGWRELD